MLIGLGIVAVGWAVVAAQTVVTARAGESLLYLLRVRSYAHLQRLGLDYYERELSGRIMTRMTTDVDALSTFLQTGLAQAVVSLLTVGRRRGGAADHRPGAGAGGARGAARARRGHAVVPSALVARLRRGPRAGGHGQRGPAGERHRACVWPRRSPASSAAPRTFADRSAAYRGSRLRAQRYIATYFPFVALLSDLATAAVLGVGAARVAGGELTPGVLTAFLLYLGLFFAPVQQLSQVFDGYQQARIGLRRIAELLRTPTTVPDDGTERCSAAAWRRGAARRRLLLHRRGEAGPGRGVAAGGGGGDGRAGRRDRRGQIDLGQAAGPVLRRRERRCARRRG